MAIEINMIPSKIDGVPFLLQTDPRWENVPYTIQADPEQTIGTSGCVPTTQAMIASYFRGEPVSPRLLADWNIAQGFRTTNSGTDTLRSMPAFGEAFELGIERIDLTETSVREALGRPALILTIVRHPDRERTLATPGGHAILIRSISEQGELRVSSSASVEKSLKDWHVDQVLKIADPLRTFVVHP